MLLALESFVSKVAISASMPERIVAISVCSFNFGTDNSKFLNWLNPMRFLVEPELAFSSNLLKTGELINRCHFFSPAGDVGVQDKLHMTRFEKEDWIVRSGKRFKVFDTDFGKVAIAICYDVEFPELARTAARAGATVLIVPSCTDDRQGYLRVRYCAQARAIENQMYVLACNRTGKKNHLEFSGDSCIISPWGELTYTAGRKVSSDVITVDLQLQNDIRKKFPFLLDAKQSGFQFNPNKKRS